MRIGFFHPAMATPGGAELLCVAQAQYLRTFGDDVHVVTFAFDPAWWGERMAHIPISVVPKYVGSDLFKWPSRLAKMRRRGHRAVRSFVGDDVAFAHNFPCNAMLGNAELTVRKVWQCNEPPRNVHARLANPVLSQRVQTAPAAPDEAATIAWRRILAEIESSRPLAATARYDIDAVGRLDAVFAISEFSRDNARRIYGRCADEVVYPIVGFPTGGGSRSGLCRDALGVLVHSRLEVMKNIDTVIRGFATFLRARAGAHLHVVGDGAARVELEQFAASQLPAASFTFHGYLPDAALTRVYQACEVFALLPLDEPFGMVFPEAAARGLLLIGPDHGGPLEILDGGRVGWCVDAFSADALADALSTIAGLPDSQVDERRREADRACRARYAQEVVGPMLRRAVTAGQ